MTHTVFYSYRDADFKEVKQIVEKSVSGVSDIDITALKNWAARSASRQGHLDMVKYLVENDADITDWNNEAIGWASGNGHVDVVKYLVEKGADVTANDNFSARCASVYGYLDVVKYLLSFYTHENIYTLKDKINQELYEKEVAKIETLKEQKRQVTDMIYCSPDLLPKSNLRVMGYNVILGLEMIENL